MEWKLKGHSPKLDFFCTDVKVTLDDTNLSPIPAKELHTNQVHSRHHCSVRQCCICSPCWRSQCLFEVFLEVRKSHTCHRPYIKIRDCQSVIPGNSALNACLKPIVQPPTQRNQGYKFFSLCGSRNWSKLPLSRSSLDIPTSMVVIGLLATSSMSSSPFLMS